MTEPLRCHAKSRAGVQCKNLAMAGQKVCRFHGGKSPQALAGAERRLTRQRALGQVGELLAEMGEDPVPDPLTGLEVAYHRAARMCAVLGVLVEDLDDVVGLNRHDEYVIHPVVSEHRTWLELYARIQKLALDAGIDERRLARDEREARALLEAVAGTLDDTEVGLTPAQREAFSVKLAGRLRALDPGAAG